MAAGDTDTGELCFAFQERAYEFSDQLRQALDLGGAQGSHQQLQARIDLMFGPSNKCLARSGHLQSGDPAISTARPTINQFLGLQAIQDQAGRGWRCPHPLGYLSHTQARVEGDEAKQTRLVHCDGSVRKRLDGAALQDVVDH